MEQLSSLIASFKAKTGLEPASVGWTLGGVLTLVMVVLLFKPVLTKLWGSLKSLWAAPVATPPCCCTSEDSTPAPVEPTLLQRWVSAIDYLSTRREWRYRHPFMLMLGQAGAGKTSLMQSIPAKIRQPLRGKEEELAIKDLEWHVFANGMIIDPKGQLPWQAADGIAAASKQWDEILTRLDALRPERAIDGIVLVVSAPTLLGGSKEQQTALAENARKQLATIEKRFEFALPVYVVVTQCDQIEGFAAFWRAQNEHRLQEMFGWSAPRQNPDGPPSAWANAAFDQIGQTLKAIQVDTAARCEGLDAHDADAFFLFPRHFQQLRTPFREWLGVVFQAVPWQTTFFCRGIYFTGPVAPIAQEGSGPVLAPATARNDINFVLDLVQAKVLTEARLARPTRHGIWSRNDIIRRLQVSALLGLALMAVLLLLSCIDVRYRVDHVVDALKTMQHLQAPLDGQCPSQEAVYQLIGQVAKIDTEARTPLIPLSLFDARLNQKSAQYIADKAFKNVILPGIACHLEQRANALNSPANTTASLDTSYAASLDSLYQSVQQATEFEQNLVRWQRVLGNSPYTQGQSALSEFVLLTEYAYRTPLKKAGLHSGILPATLAALNYRHYTSGLKIPSGLRQNLANQIHKQALQVHQQMMAELQLGQSLLKKLEQYQQPLLANSSRWVGWLNWVRQSWLGSNDTNNPLLQVQTALASKVQPLITQFGYPATPLNEASNQFDASHNYPLAMNRLKALQLPDYGALFTVQNQQLDLNPRLDAEIRGLSRLNTLDFMQIDNAQAFNCNGKVSQWNPIYLSMANTYAKSYQQFLQTVNESGSTGSAASASSGTGSSASSGASANTTASATTSATATASSVNLTSTSALYQRLARHQLELALNHSLAQAQSQAAVTSVSTQPGINPNASSELALSQESNDFNKLQPALLNVTQIFNSYQFTQSATQLNQCVRNFASNQLSKVQLLADQSRLYEATPALNAGNGNFYDLGSVPVIKDYLAQQVARAQSLVGYATPFLTWLNSTPGTSSARGNSDSAPYWNNTSSQITQYSQGKDPNAQPSYLDNLFLKVLPDLSNSTCNKTLAGYQSPTLGNDLFSAARQQLEKQMQSRCKGERYAQATTLYQSWAKRFNSELAGRYPFGTLDAADASPTTVKAFFVDYEANSAALKQSLAGLDDSFNNARNFLAQLDAVDKFFHANLVTGDTDPQSTDGNPAIKLAVIFRAQPNHSPGSDQLATWTLSSGAKSIAYPNRGTSLDWAYQQGLILDLSWATLSNWRPANNGGQQDLQTDSLGASFAASGDWALLRMIERHKPKTASQVDALDPNRLLLEFIVPTQNTVGGKSVFDTARLYLNLNLSSKDPATGAVVKLKLPTSFPRLAPQ